MLWSLAARNLWRNGRRTAITVAAVAFGLMMMLYTITMQSGQYDQMIRTAVGSLAGHVVVQAPGYGDDSEQAPLVSGVQLSLIHI